MELWGTILRNYFGCKDTGSEDQSSSLQGFLCCVPFSGLCSTVWRFWSCFKFASRKSLQENCIKMCFNRLYFSRQSFYPPPKSQNCTEHTNNKQGCEITSTVMQPRTRLKRLCCSAWPTSERNIKPDSWCPHCAVAVSQSEHNPVTASYNLSADWYCFWSASCRSWELWIKANFTKKFISMWKYQYFNCGKDKDNSMKKKNLCSLKLYL